MAARQALQPRQEEPDWIARLRTFARENSIAEAAVKVRRSRTAISLLLAGKYPAKSLTPLRHAVELAFRERVPCPVLGQIDSAACADHAARPLNTTSPQAVRLWRACRSCPNRHGGDDA